MVKQIEILQDVFRTTVRNDMLVSKQQHTIRIRYSQVEIMRDEQGRCKVRCHK